jgi:hypothetical protein
VEVAIVDGAQQRTEPELGTEQAAANAPAPPARSPGAGSGSELKRVVDAAAQRVDEIVDGAERVASGILAEAEADAARYVDGRRQEVERAIDAWSADLRGVAELLGEQEVRLRELTEAMIAELEEVAAVLGRIPPELDRRRELQPESSPQAPSASPAPTPEQGERVDPGAGSAEPDRPASGQAADTAAPDSPSRPSSHGREKALLRAAQMAVAGSSREEIERALAAELEIRDPAPIVDGLLGPRS